MSVSQSHPAPTSSLALAHRHAPDARVLLWEGAAGWQVRLTARNAADHAHRAWSGQLGLQLWHPTHQLSVLLPTAASDDSYELYSPTGGAVRLGCYHGVCRALAQRLGDAPLPPPQVLTELHVRFVLSALIGATRPADPA